MITNYFKFYQTQLTRKRFGTATNGPKLGIPRASLKLIMTFRYACHWAGGDEPSVEVDIALKIITTDHFKRSRPTGFLYDVIT